MNRSESLDLLKGCIPDAPKRTNYEDVNRA